MKRIPSVVTGIAAGIALALATAISAQPYGGMGPGMGPGMGMGPGTGMGPGMGHGYGRGPAAAGDVAAYTDARLADIKARLNINTGQEGAWQAFAAQFKQQAQQRQAMRAQMWNDDGTAAERMAQHSQAMAQRAAGMAAMSDAVNGLYGALTPEQKVVADQLFAHRGGGRHGPRG